MRLKNRILILTPAWVTFVSGLNTHLNVKVKGLTCTTCAMGREVMLRQQKGDRRAHASDSQNSVAIGFDGKVTPEKVLKEFIVDCGSSVA